MKKAMGPNGHKVGNIKVEDSKMAKLKAKANNIVSKGCSGLGALKGLK
jgi:hypothetical protein